MSQASSVCFVVTSVICQKSTGTLNFLKIIFKFKVKDIDRILSCGIRDSEQL